MNSRIAIVDPGISSWPSTFQLSPRRPSEAPPSPTSLCSARLNHWSTLSQRYSTVARVSYSSSLRPAPTSRRTPKCFDMCSTPRTDFFLLAMLRPHLREFHERQLIPFHLLWPSPSTQIIAQSYVVSLGLSWSHSSAPSWGSVNSVRSQPMHFNTSKKTPHETSPTTRPTRFLTRRSWNPANEADFRIIGPSSLLPKVCMNLRISEWDYIFMSYPWLTISSRSVQFLTLPAGTHCLAFLDQIPKLPVDWKLGLPASYHLQIYFERSQDTFCFTRFYVRLYHILYHFCAASSFHNKCVLLMGYASKRVGTCHSLCVGRNRT